MAGAHLDGSQLWRTRRKKQVRAFAVAQKPLHNDVLLPPHAMAPPAGERGEKRAFIHSAGFGDADDAVVMRDAGAVQGREHGGVGVLAEGVEVGAEGAAEEDGVLRDDGLSKKKKGKHELKKRRDSGGRLTKPDRRSLSPML